MTVPIPKTNPARVGAIVAGGAIAAAVALYWFAQRSAPTPERVAQVWASENRGVAEDNLNALIRTRAGGLGIRVGEGDALKWSYSPPKPAGGDRYELSAGASVRLDIPIMDTLDSARVVGLYAVEAALPFHLTVDMGTRTVTDWRVHLSEGEFAGGMPPAPDGGGFEGEARDCMRAASDAGLPDYAMRTLVKPPSERDRAETIQMNAALMSKGVMDVCQPYLETTAP